MSRCLALWLFDGHLERRLAACDQAGELGRLLAYVGGRFTRGVPDLACETVPREGIERGREVPYSTLRSRYEYPRVGIGWMEDDSD